jgi:hypothetical protein
LDGACLSCFVAARCEKIDRSRSRIRPNTRRVDYQTKIGEMGTPRRGKKRKEERAADGREQESSKRAKYLYAREPGIDQRNGANGTARWGSRHTRRRLPRRMSTTSVMPRLARLSARVFFHRPGGAIGAGAGNWNSNHLPPRRGFGDQHMPAARTNGDIEPSNRGYRRLCGWHSTLVGYGYSHY